MKSSKLLPLVILLLSSSSIESSTTTDSNNVNNVKVEANHSVPPSVKDQQRLVTTCYAHRAVMGHDGEIAQWKAKCRVEVWAGDSQTPPELKELTSEQRDKVMNEYARKNSDLAASGSESADEIAEKSKYLVQEAENRHKICMEAKRTILAKLKELLPAGYNSNEKVQEAMEKLQLTPELEMFIDHVNGDMKNTVALIHSIEHNTQLPEDQKMEQLRVAKVKLTELLDEKCKDDHPSIRYQNVGYFPPVNIDKAKTTLIINHGDPNHRIEVVHWPPESTYSPHYENLKEITNAVAHHAALSSNPAGPYVAHLNDLNSKEDGNHSVVSVAKVAENPVTEPSVTEPSATEPLSQVNPISKVPDVDESNSHLSSVSPAEKYQEAIDAEYTITRDNADIYANFWNGINGADQAYKDKVATIEADKSITADNLRSDFKTNAKKRYEYIKNILIKDLLKEENLVQITRFDDDNSTRKEWKKKFKDLNGKEQEIESKYLKSKAILKKAVKQASESKSIWDKLTLKKNLPEIIYKEAKKMIQSERDTAKLELNNPVASETISINGPETIVPNDQVNDNTTCDQNPPEPDGSTVDDSKTVSSAEPAVKTPDISINSIDSTTDKAVIDNNNNVPIDPSATNDPQNIVSKPLDKQGKTSTINLFGLTQ